MAAAAKLGGRSWFCTTGLPSDVVIEVADMSFHLHKFPLMAKSRRLQLLIREQEAKPNPNPDTGEDQGEIKEEVGEEERRQDVIVLQGFPGGPESFEVAAKFCYGVKIELTAWNVAQLRCAAEYLEMTEDFSEDNLVARTERFLAQSVLRNIRESIKTLKSCEELGPIADELGIVQRCVDAVAARAAAADPTALFGWPVNDSSGVAGVRRRRGEMRSSPGSDLGSWFDDLAILGLGSYRRLIAAMKEKDPSSDVIEGSLMSYARRLIPGLTRSSRKHSSAPLTSEAEQRELLETVIWNLPSPVPGRRSAAAARVGATTKLLFGMLRTASILRVGEASREALERKIASQLDRATLEDLLIPSYSYLAETLYDVDCVERILAHFLGSSVAVPAEFETEAEAAVRATSLNRVAKLIDGYLAEIASDENLKPDKFCGLALALPEEARVYDDGLYRAIDIYLKAHPQISEEERMRVCGVMDCRKLTMEACTHAAQNERLPLRAVLQVLFFEQLQLRQAITGTVLMAGDREETAGVRPVVVPGQLVGRQQRSWQTAIRENQVLRLDMDSMRNRVHELEKECSNMKKAIGKLDGNGSKRTEDGQTDGKKKKKLGGCRFSTQVCDSQERNVVQSRATKIELSP